MVGVDVNTHKDRIGLDDFKVLKVVGQGAFGKVYKDWKHSSLEIFAMKAMRKRFPKLVNHPDYLGVQVVWVTVSWFLSIFMNMLPWESVRRVWDVLLFEGDRIILFRTSLALMELYGLALVTTKNVGDAVTLLQSLAGSTFDSSQLVLTAYMGYPNVNEAMVEFSWWSFDKLSRWKFLGLVYKEVAMFMNAGGEVPVETDAQISLLADNFFEGGDIFQTEESITEAGDYPFIYQSARLGNFCYRFCNFHPGEHFVDLHFMEIINTYGPIGMRVFNVFMQDKKVLSDFDIFSIVGANKPLQLVDLQVSVTNLLAQPSEGGFRLALRSGIILEGATLSAYQCFENARNFLVAVEDMGIPTFEASVMKQGGKSSRIVNCVLALKSYSEWKERGGHGIWNLGGNLKPSPSRKQLVRKKSEPFMNRFSMSLSSEKSLDSFSGEDSGHDLNDDEIKAQEMKQQNYSTSKWHLHQLLIECPSLHELMACPNFNWEHIPLLELWRQNQESEPRALLGSTLCVILMKFLSAHLLSWKKPKEQKTILVIILMAPLYAVDSYVGLLDFRGSESFFMFSNSVKECYEALVMAKFFALLYTYLNILISKNIVPDEIKGREIHHSFPMTLFLPHSVSLNHNILKQLKYWTWQFIRPVCSILMIALQLFDMYPTWLSWTLTIILNISVSLALYSLVVFYHVC